MKNKSLSGLLALSALAFTGFAAAPAAAGQIQSCNVQYVAFENEHLIVKCAELASEIHGSGPGWTQCNGLLRQSLDTLKIWASMGQTALVGGKRLFINYQDSAPGCAAPTNAITYVRLIH